MNIKSYLDSTYLKLPEQVGLSEEEHLKVVKNCIQEAIDEAFKLIMIRPEMVKIAREMIDKAGSKVGVGTVIGFPEGTASLTQKLEEANQAIIDGADDLDFVCNYQAFKLGNTALLKQEILEGTRLGLEHHKVVKWIIEVAALTHEEIIRLAALIKNVIIANFKEPQFPNVFVKSSTGFYPTKEGVPNGATLPTVVLMLENCWPLPVKAAGGVRTTSEALEMIKLGVKRIGTSAAKSIAHGEISTTAY